MSVEQEIHTAIRTAGHNGTKAKARLEDLYHVIIRRNKRLQRSNDTLTENIKGQKMSLDQTKKHLTQADKVIKDLENGTEKDILKATIANLLEAKTQLEQQISKQREELEDAKRDALVQAW